MNMRPRFRTGAAACALALWVWASPAAAQGLQTSEVAGTIATSDGLGLPGATVSVTSPALQGERTTITDVNGAYVLRGLPAGIYSVAMSLTGLASQQHTVTLAVGSTTRLDGVMAVATVNEIVQVVAASPALTSPSTVTHVREGLVNVLPLGRTPQTIAELAPNVSDSTANAGQLSIGGAFGYDSTFLIDGVDVNDNIFGTPHALFIEDAIEETQVLSAGLSAEYGRFSGGVVNVVTKRGGDVRSGSYRATLTNPSWTDETPFERSRNTVRPDILSHMHEVTLGGPVVRQRLWYFGAGRFENANDARTLRETGLAYTLGTENTRVEGKLTSTFDARHTIQATVINNATTNRNRPGLNGSVDPRTLVTRSLPNRLFVANYNGVITPSVFGSVQVSQKHYGLRNNGGTSTAIVESPFRTRGTTGIPANLHYNAPYFDSNDPENRDNRQITASIATSVARPHMGTHELKAGLEHFTSTYVGGNSQTSTGFIFYSDYKVDAAGRPLFDADGRMIPRFIPGVSRLYTWLASRGAEMDIHTSSLFAQDRWRVHPRLTLDLGLRAERVKSNATGGVVGANTSTIVPRLAASFDVAPASGTVLLATYGHYAGRYSEAQFTRNTDVANPGLVISQYAGPGGEGVGFTPGFDVANYPATLGGSFPTANVSFADDLSTPITRELTVAAGRALGARGHAKATYVWRRTANVIEDFFQRSQGSTTVVRNGVNFGAFDNQVFDNTSEVGRRYQALVLQSTYELARSWHVAGHWTVQLENAGNFEGEAANQPGAASPFGDYPEVFTAERHYPFGRLDEFQRHKVRAWTTKRFDFRSAGSVDLGVLYRYNSGLTYSLTATGVPLSATQRALASGYANLPGNGAQTLYFGERGAGSFKGYALVDLAATYGLPLWGTVKPWLKLEVLNALNNQKLTSWDTTITPNTAGPLDDLGLPLTYTEGPRFGQATRNGNYASYRPGFDGGRTFIAAMGFRF